MGNSDLLPTANRSCYFLNGSGVVPSSGQKNFESLDQNRIDCGVIRLEVSASAVTVRLNHIHIYSSQLIGTARHNIPGPEECLRLRLYSAEEIDDVRTVANLEGRKPANRKS